MFIESLESRRLLAGVTVLTHGYQGDVNFWVDKASEGIFARAGGAQNVSTYVLSIGEVASGKLGVKFYTRESGSNSPLTTAAAEIVIKLDWSTVSGGPWSTGQVAKVVGDFLLGGNADGVRLARLPIHLAGHSRGASLMTAVSLQLGRAGVWVDQQTNLDPHPVDGVNDPAGFDLGDTPMATYDNVTFADTYWRTDGNVNNFDFDGEPVAGTHQGDLNNSVQKQFIGGAHAGVPAYYVGTINLTTNDGGDSPIIGNWYGNIPSKPARDQTGYLFSRMVAGPRPADGLWDAQGGSAARVPAGEAGSQWANVGDVRVMGGRNFPVGSGITVRFIRQDRDGKANVQLLLDPDTNPFNNNFVRTIDKTNVSQADEIIPVRRRGSTNGAGPGRYWICVRITDSQGHVRYAYSKSFNLTANSSITHAIHSPTPPAFSEEKIDEPEQLEQLV